MSADCFLPNGTKYDDPGVIPCNRTAVENGGHSVCCYTNDLCLTNGMCRNQGNDADGYNYYWRDGCTDSNWEDSACPKYCTGEDYEEDRNRLIFNCLDSSNTKWACRPTDVSLTAIVMTAGCDDSAFAFTAAAPLIYATAQLPSIPRVSTTSTATSLSSISQQSIASSDRTSATATAITTSTSPPSSSSSTASNSSSGTSTGTKVGLGVGISLGVLFLAVIGATIVMLKRRKAARPSEVDGREVAGYGKPRHFTSGQPHVAQVYEADAQPKPAELAGSVR